MRRAAAAILLAPEAAVSFSARLLRWPAFPSHSTPMKSTAILFRSQKHPEVPVARTALCVVTLLGCVSAFGQSSGGAAASAPAGATGICNNGEYVYVAEKKGSCRGRQGILEWFADRGKVDSGAPTANAAASVALSPEANAALASEKGFDLNAVCDNNGRSSSKLTFREEADHYVVAIDNLSRGSCKSEAHATSSTTFTFNGCRDTNIVMAFDSADKSTPFTGKSTACSYVFKTR